MRNDDADLIDRMLRDQLERVLDAYAPGWELSKDKKRALLSAKGPKDPGSFQVTLHGPHRGGWSRFSRNIHGGPIKLLAYLLNGRSDTISSGDFRTAFQDARRFLGLEQGASGITDEQRAEADRKREERRRQQERQKAEDELRRQQVAAHVWADGVPINGTAAEAYLVNRVGEMDWPDCLAFGRRVLHPSGTWSQALLCRVDDAAGELIGVWRIFVNNHGDKAFGDESKLGLGPVRGGAVRLGGEPDDGLIGLAEGVETALSVMRLIRGAMPVWSALSTSGLMNFEPPPFVADVRIFPDHDPDIRAWTDEGQVRSAPSPGLEAANKALRHLQQLGVNCLIDPSRPRRGRDFNDVLRRSRAVLA